MIMKHFKEPLNTAVFTTRFIISGESVIVFIAHDDDGSWQFQGTENKVSESDMRLVSLGEIIEIDNSILQLADMPEGFEAMRNDKNSNWIITSSN